jgi:hypothetical protein
MLRTPASYPEDATPCDPRLPQAALKFRLEHLPPLTTPRFLGGFNVTAWLYRDKTGTQDIRVDVNTTIEELQRKFGPAETPDAEVGIHSEAKSAQWFQGKRNLQVLQIFSERIPCWQGCSPMLRKYFAGVPWYYYYKRGSWLQGGKILKYPADVLKTVYGLQ